MTVTVMVMVMVMVVDNGGGVVVDTNITTIMEFEYPSSHFPESRVG